jgi:hypothetical protein
MFATMQRPKNKSMFCKSFMWCGLFLACKGEIFYIYTVIYNIIHTIYSNYVGFKCKKPILGVVAFGARMQTSFHSCPMQ